LRGWLDTRWMLIALFAVLGVDLVVIVVLVAVVLARKRWVSDEPGAFRGAIRITGGEVPGSGRGGGAAMAAGSGRFSSGRRRRLFRNELVVADAAAGAARAAKPGEVRGVGKQPRLWRWPSAAARVEVAASADGCERAAGPFAVGGR
jgi:hypothetical protein